MYCFCFSEKFHTLALEGIPIFGLSNKAAAHRFVTLVDVSPFPYLKWFTRV
jgi:predicted ATPase